MSIRSVDIYATTNPALCSIVLWSFVAGFVEEESSGVEYPLIFLPLPFVLSGSIAQLFDGTNAKTGFLTWVAKKPELLVDLAKRMEQTTNYTRDALLFAIHYDILAINDQGNFITTSSFTPNSSKLAKLSSELKSTRSYSNRLGKWLGQLKSTETALQSLGLTL